MKVYFVLNIFLILLIFPIGAWAQGGPPLVTDDPETPGDGHWEINIAEQSESLTSGTLIQIPYFDINYGWGDRIQLKFETGGEIFSGPQNNFEGGWGNALAGVKWRFIDDKSHEFLVSTYPQVNFRYFLTNLDPAFGSANNWIFLPLEFAKHFGPFAINPEIGYLIYSQGVNQYVYGIVFAYKISLALELLSEMHFNTNVDGSGTESLFNVGARCDLNEGLSLIGSFGHTLSVYPGETQELLTYLGIQIRI
jgi:hypothetical protein